MVDFTAHLGKYTKIKQLSRKISQFRQIFVFTAKFLSLPLGGAAKFFTASGNSIPPTFRYLAVNSGHLASLATKDGKTQSNCGRNKKAKKA